MVAEIERKWLAYIRLGRFSVDSEGRIWRHAQRAKSGRPGWVKLTTQRRAESASGAYLAVSIELRGKRRRIQAHRAVSMAANNCIIPAGMLPNHKNGDKHDNRPGNLELVTFSENAIHARDELGVGPWSQPNG